MHTGIERLLPSLKIIYHLIMLMFAFYTYEIILKNQIKF